MKLQLPFHFQWNRDYVYMLLFDTVYIHLKNLNILKKNRVNYSRIQVLVILLQFRKGVGLKRYNMPRVLRF